MSSDLAIRVSGLSKNYKLSQQATHSTFAESLVERLRHPFRRRPSEPFNALADVNLEVFEGQVLGVIGRNGAGKSTLLKILTRITSPSSGEVELFGRVGSLLEVGTGFHPELTGRENIYLNGAILGMRKRELDKRFGDIVEFAGVEKFIETPVKRYSSGMYVRLAFAVAAHLDTEILIVDEVLAVGDSEFQRRCLGKMSDIASAGRTVLFVSHQMEPLAALCTHALYLERGRTVFYGDVSTAIRTYLADVEALAKAPEKRAGSGELRIANVRPEQPSYRCDEVKVLRLTIEQQRSANQRFCALLWIYDSDNRIVTQCDSRLLGEWFEPQERLELRVSIRSPWLAPGRYKIGVALRTQGQHESIDEVFGACDLVVLPILPYEATDSWAWDQGVVLADFAIE